MFLNLPKSSKSIPKERKSLNNDDCPELSNILRQDPTSKSLKTNNLFLNFLISASLPKRNENSNIVNEMSNNNISNNNISVNNISVNNISIQKSSKNIREVEKYQFNPFRRINLKLVGQDIKQKLIKMNVFNDTFEDDKINSSPMDEKENVFLNIKTDNCMDNLPISAITDTYEIPKIEKKTNLENFKLTEGRNDINEKSHSCNYIPKITFKNKKNLDIKNNNTTNASPVSQKENIKKKHHFYRKLNKKNLIYDSMEDNESEEIEDIIINPESKFIFYFDFLIIIFYLYSFLLITNNIAQIKCLCSYHNSALNDFVLYFTDIL